MTYDDIYRSFRRIDKAMKEGNEIERKTWRKITKDYEKIGKTTKDIIGEMCDKNREKSEKEFKKLNDPSTPDLERDIILCKYFCIALPLALTGHVYRLPKPNNRRKRHVNRKKNTK